MSLLVVIILLLLIFGGGGGYYAHGRYGTPGLAGVVGFILLFVVVMWFFGALIGVDMRS